MSSYKSSLGSTSIPRHKPIVGITMGDPAGVGPEVILKALEQPKIWRSCLPVIVGDKNVFNREAARLRISTEFEELKDTADWVYPAIPSGNFLVESSKLENLDDMPEGEPSMVGGQTSLAAIEKAAQLALSGRFNAIVTAPVSKISLKMAGCEHPGHTELLAELTDTPKSLMMMMGGGLKVVLATVHVPLTQVPSLITKEHLLSVFKRTSESLHTITRRAPKIAVCGLNPHASDGGIMGTEEAEIIRPAIEEAQASGIDIEGPFPADTIFHQALQDEYDVVIAMYHDQALIPIKTLDFDRGVNVTLGLPIIRTSPDHGTAFDIAGQGMASPNSLITAITAALRIYEKRL
jgi:4-hydroxythreonine-4-phosphate dehydrogenase